MKLNLKLTVVALSVVLGAGVFSTVSKSGQANVSLTEKKLARLTVSEEYPHVISRGSTLYTVLANLNVPPQTIGEIVRAAKLETNLKRVMPGTRFHIKRTLGPIQELIAIKFRFSPTDIIEIKNESSQWTATRVDVKVEQRLISFKGVVTDTLWGSAEKAQMDPNLISELADIFAWQVDFAREVRVNDRWRISVEQKFVDGESIGWGNIIAAEYENRGRTYSAVLFSVGEKTLGYFAPDGTSLKRMFLKSPIRYGRISSRFQRRRFHPILKVHRPHNGVDYAAARGTPVRAVGSGVLTFVGRKGGGGNTIKIRHNSVYQTAYLHLNGFAKGIRSGARVNQGQIIGYVGSTGLSTAPHLHFEFFRSGRYVDPLGQQFPSADPVPAQYLSQFKSDAVLHLNSLPAWESTEVALREPSSESKMPEVSERTPGI